MGLETMSALVLADMIFSPVFEPFSTLMIAGLVAALAISVYFRSLQSRPALSICMAIMRLILIGTIAILLMGPSFLPPAMNTPGRPTLSIMVDTSASMQTQDADGIARYDFAVNHWLNERHLAELNRECNVRLFGFDENPQRLSTTTLRRPAREVANGRVSNVAQSIRSTVMGLTGGANQSTIVVISDGKDTDNERFQPVAQMAAAKLIPIHAVALGGDSPQRDVALTVLPMQEYLFAGEKGELVVKAMQTNAGEMTTTLQLQCTNQLIQKPIAFEGRSSVTVTVPIKHEEAGQYEYSLSIVPVAAEFATNNNHQSLFINVTAQPLRVLVLEGEPHWDTKFLARSLHNDESIELHQITQLSQKRREQIVSRTSVNVEVPSTLEDLATYDVIILGRGIEHVIPYNILRLLPIYVSQYGGRLVFARGRAYNPNTAEGRRAGDELAVLEPVQWGHDFLQDQKLTLASAGRIHPCFAYATTRHGGIGSLVSELPGMTVIPVISQKPATKVLAHTRPTGIADDSGPHGRPALVTMPYDRGMIVAVLGEGLWKWNLLTRETSHLQGVFDQFWSNLIRWLVMSGDFQPGRQTSVRLSRQIVQIGEPLTINVSHRIPGLNQSRTKIVIVDPAGKHYQPALQDIGHSGGARQQAEFEPQAVGVHRVLLESSDPANSIEAKFNVHDVDFERLLSVPDRDSMRLLAQQSGGVFLNPREPETLFDLLQRYRASVVTPPQPIYVWDRAWILVLILIWAGAEWLLRKTGGLL